MNTKIWEDLFSQRAARQNSEKIEGRHHVISAQIYFFHNDNEID